MYTKLHFIIVRELFKYNIEEDVSIKKLKLSPNYVTTNTVMPCCTRDVVFERQ